MTVYNTIDSAFKNGTGDVFFTNNDGKFVARSRHIENLVARMAVEGFTHVPYMEAMQIAKDQKATLHPELVVSLETYWATRL